MKEIPPKHDLTEPRPWFSLFHARGGWLAIIAAVICLAVTLWSVSQYRAAARYELVGVVTQAEAVNRRIRTDSEGDDDHYVTYRFLVGEQIIERQRKVSQSQYNRSPRGSSHDVRYLPNTPAQFETYVGEAHDDAVALQWFAAISGIGGLIALWFVGGRTNRTVLTRRYGYRTAARIERIVETKTSGRPSGRGYLIWRTKDGVRGESLMHRIGKLNAIGVGADINVYVRKGHSVWEGDVGPHKVDDSRLPQVRR
jgi:hypothetical protein